MAVPLGMQCMTEEGTKGGREIFVTEDISLDDVNGMEIRPGDRVLFKRGGLWRGSLKLKGGTLSNPVLYGAYGEGAAPVLAASIDASHMEDWTEVSPGMWRLAVDVAEDVGAMWFDGEAATGFKKDRLEDVLEDLDFHSDRASRTTLLKSAANPASRFSSVELARGVHGVSLSGQEGVVFENLHVRGAGFHGFSASAVRGLAIRGCIFDRIGGGELYVTEQGVHVRFGNAIEFWGDARDIVVESNRIDQIYDAALTHQCSSPAQTQSNIVWRKNHVSRSEYSFEYWQQGEGSITENILVEDNLFEGAGEGFGHTQRWNPNAGHVVLQDNTAKTTDFVFRRNRFGSSLGRGMRIFNEWSEGPSFEGNTWDLGSAKELCLNHARPSGRAKLEHLYPDYADCRHVDDKAEIEKESESIPSVYPNSREGFERFSRDFGLKGDIFKG